MARGQKWSLEETKMAFYLWRVLPDKQCDDQDPIIISLAQALDRTPNSVAMKIWNIAAYDEQRVLKGKKGLTNGSKLDREIWGLFSHNEGAFLNECCELYEATTINSKHRITIEKLIELPEGKEREAIVAQRVNQNYFRKQVLSNYDSHCCLTNLDNTNVLMASHIKPWSASDPKEKLDPSNGLLLNAFHDKAFDQGLMTIKKQSGRHIMVVSSHIRKTPVNQRWFY